MAKFPFLPDEIRQIIWEYHKEPAKFWIVDMGSICGTFIKLSCSESYEI